MAVLGLLLVVLWQAPLRAERIIHFAGVDWKVKNGGPYGPGPNYWSDSPQSVWIDSLGRLHLKIRKENGRWYCAEVRTVNPTHYGEHRFLVNGFIDRMDKNIVLGLFVYADDLDEIDIEYSKWGYEGKTDVGSYTVQPYSTPGNEYSFESPLDSAKTTHYFDWQSGYVMFGSMHGYFYGAPPSDNYYIARWIYSGSDNPSDTRNLHTHINLWLNNGEAPQDLSVLEVIIKDVVQPLNTSALETNTQLPATTELEPNFPNPFNPATTIEYAIDKPCLVDLSVYTIRGQKVKQLVHQFRSPGRYRVRLNAGDLASGIYFYKLKAGTFTKVRKMLLVK